MVSSASRRIHCCPMNVKVGGNGDYEEVKACMLRLGRIAMRRNQARCARRESVIVLRVICRFPCHALRRESFTPTSLAMSKALTSSLPSFNTARYHLSTFNQDDSYASKTAQTSLHHLPGRNSQVMFTPTSRMRPTRAKLAMYGTR